MLETNRSLSPTLRRIITLDKRATYQVKEPVLLNKLSRILEKRFNRQEAKAVQDNLLTPQKFRKSLSTHKLRKQRAKELTSIKAKLKEKQPEIKAKDFGDLLLKYNSNVTSTRNNGTYRAETELFKLFSVPKTIDKRIITPIGKIKGKFKSSKANNEFSEGTECVPDTLKAKKRSKSYAGLHEPTVKLPVIIRKGNESPKLRVEGLEAKVIGGSVKKDKPIIKTRSSAPLFIADSNKKIPTNVAALLRYISNHPPRPSNL